MPGSSGRGLPLAALLLAALPAVATLPGCQTLREIAALRSVDFEFGGVSDVRLAGISLENVRSLGDLGLVDGARIAAAVAERKLPLALTLGVQGTNPEGNGTSARLVRLDWVLFLQGNETVSGVVEGPVALPPGQAVDIPVAVVLDLFEFFEGSASDLVGLAAGLTGLSDRVTEIRLRATPTVDTPLGPIRYPEPVTIANVRVGG